jgi:hypothetical protein
MVTVSLGIARLSSLKLMMWCALIITTLSTLERALLKSPKDSRHLLLF